MFLKNSITELENIYNLRVNWVNDYLKPGWSRARQRGTNCRFCDHNGINHTGRAGAARKIIERFDAAESGEGEERKNTVVNVDSGEGGGERKIGGRRKTRRKRTRKRKTRKKGGKRKRRKN